MGNFSISFNKWRIRSLFLLMAITVILTFLSMDTFQVSVNRPFYKSRDQTVNQNLGDSPHLVQIERTKPAASLVVTIKPKNPFPVIARVMGGIGNQLFQYSTSYAVARSRNSDLFICLSESEYNATLSPDRKNVTNHKLEALDRSYALDMFNIPHDKLLVIKQGMSDCPVESNPEFGKITSKDITTFNELDILTDVVPKDKVVMKSGYVESQMLFKNYREELMDFLTLDVKTESNPNLSKLFLKIESTDSVSIHVRKRDYITNPNDMRNMTNDYYIRALNLMIEKLTKQGRTTPDRNITFFVFSDDIESVKVDFSILFQNITHEMIYCSNDNFSRIIDFFLMSKCKNNIISAGTYAFWTAYLNRNPNKIIIAPLPRYPPTWFAQLGMNSDSTMDRVLREIHDGKWTYPTDWITLDPLFHKIDKTLTTQASKKL